MKSSTAPTQESAPLDMFLRIKHPTLDPDQITEALGIEPEHAVHAGPAASRSGVQRLHSECYWLGRLPTRTLQQMRLGVRTTSAPDAYPTFTREKVLDLLHATQFDNWVLDALQPLAEKKQFLQQLNREGSIALLIQRTDQGTPLSLRVSLIKLAELGITLEVD